MADDDDDDDDDVPIKLLYKCYLVALISTRGVTLDNLLLPRSSTFFALQVIRGSLVSAVAYFLSLRARNSMNF